MNNTMLNQMMKAGMNMKVNNLLNQLKVRNPQMFQVIEKASQNQSNPMDLLKQVTGNYTPEQMKNFYSVAQYMGCPNDILNQIQSQLN